MTSAITESEVEEVALEILSNLGYSTRHGPDIAPDGTSPERNAYSDVILVERLRGAIDRFNPDIPIVAREEALKKVLRIESPDLIINNHNFHKMAVDGVDIEYRRDDGSIAWGKVWLLDFENPEKNEFLAVNQFTVIENNNNRRPDIVLFKRTPANRNRTQEPCRRERDHPDGF